MNSKTDGDNAAVLSKLRCDLKKKFFTEILTVSVKSRWSPKNKVFTEILSFLFFFYRFLMGPFRAFLKPMGPLMGPEFIVPPCPPSWWLCQQRWILTTLKVPTVVLRLLYKKKYRRFRYWIPLFGTFQKENFTHFGNNIFDNFMCWTMIILFE